jgi:hypothetical protein
MYYTDSETTFEDISFAENPEPPRGWKVLVPTSDEGGNKFVHHACAGIPNRKAAQDWAKRTIANIKEGNARLPKCQREIIGTPIFTLVK